jgi:phosphate butyryltransferase
MMIQNFDQLLEHARTLGPKRVAVAGAHNEAALAAVMEAERIGLARGLFVGPTDHLRKLFTHLGRQNVPHHRLLECSVSEACAQKTVQLVRAGEADILLKGAVDSATLMRAVLEGTEGLRIGRLLSDVFLFENPRREGCQLMMITDGGVTPNPDLSQKIDIIKNAVELAQALGWDTPRVALLSATEKVTPVLPSTLDAAVISQMNQRGQITGCLVDGPLALDVAISLASAKVKGIHSPVAGRADILVAPTIEVANVLAKSTTYFAGFRLAHVVVGGRAPILIPSRSDTMEAKLLSIALGVIALR